MGRVTKLLTEFLVSLRSGKGSKDDRSQVALVEGRHLEHREILRYVLGAAGVDADDVFASINDGSALKQVRNEHESVDESHHVWGVPTFMAGTRAVFVRLMERPAGDDPAASIRAIERTLDLLTDWPALNEFKHTSLPR